MSNVPGLVINKDRKTGRHALAETVQIAALEKMLNKEGAEEAWAKRMETIDMPAGSTPFDLKVWQADVVIGFLRHDGFGEGVEYRNE